MLAALCEHLLEKPELYQDEMAVFLWDEFQVLVTAFSIGRALASIGWSKKAARRVAKERNADLRDFYLHNLSAFRSYHLVYVDESGLERTNMIIKTIQLNSPNGLRKVVKWFLKFDILEQFRTARALDPDRMEY
jgi:hypothetical protein